MDTNAFALSAGGTSADTEVAMLNMYLFAARDKGSKNFCNFRVMELKIYIHN